ncbi:hypothetical protein [Micromonospora sp. NPDC023633]|uniref:hypothetical protein n=1 Tax=Micromonospora sp. NPDC023633 TaxID=3154320 RepID=UPI00340BF879
MSYLTGDSLLVRIRIAFGATISADPATWAWTDVTDWWHVPGEVPISWGRSDGADRPETSKIRLTLKNTDGRFTSNHPMSPYWPHVVTWTPIAVDVDLGDGAGWRNRFSGYIRRWPVEWPSGSSRQALATIDAVGILGRLGRGSPPSQSPMRRSYTASQPVAYWPLEDGSTAASVASALASQPPMTITGLVSTGEIPDDQWWSGDTQWGTSTLADVSAGGQLTAQMPADAVAATSTAWSLLVATGSDIGQAAGDQVIVEVETPTATPYVRWQVRYIKALLRTQVVGINAAGAATVVHDGNGVTVGLQVVSLAVWQDGPSVRWGYDYSWTSNQWGATGTVAGTSGGLARIRMNPTGQTQAIGWAYGHLAVWPVVPPPATTGPARRDQYGRFGGGSLVSYDGEAATDRLARLAAEDGVPLVMPAVPVDGIRRMGPQPAGTPVDLYLDCEQVDHGLLYEDGFGLGYLPRHHRYNADPALVLDADDGQLGADLAPASDDQQIRNQWTVERPRGSSAVAVDYTSVDAQGLVPASSTVNVWTDDMLPDDAWWRLHLSTTSGLRYPQLGINVAAHRELASAWCEVRPGGRVQVVNPPPQAPPGVIDQLVVGASETIRGRRHWRAVLNTVPSTPWQVATVDGPQRIGAAGSTLAAGITASATSLLLSSTAETGAWTTAAADMPLDIRVGGEQVRASSIASSILDTLDRTVSGGWGPTWSVVMGSAAAFSADGTRGVIGLTGTGRHGAVIDLGSADQDVILSIRSPATATGGSIIHGWMARYVDADNHYYVEAQFRTDGQIWLSLNVRSGGVNTTYTGPTAVQAYTAGSTYRLGVQLIGSTYRARVWPGGTPPAWQVSRPATAAPAGTRAGPRALLAAGNTNPQPVAVSYDNVEALIPQRVTLSARSLNGVARAWPAGTEVDVWQPAHAAL